MKAWDKANPEKRRAYNRKWTKNNPDKVLARNKRNRPRAIQLNRLRNTGFTPEEFEAKKAVQGNMCFICCVPFSGLASKNICADHDHKTNKPRGVLCGHCNKMLGCAKDNPVILARGIEYLNLHRLL